MAERDIVCEWCGETKRKRVKPSAIPRFCDPKCSARWRMSRPEYVAAVHAVRDTPERRAADAERMRALHRRPDVAAKLHAHLHGGSNPFRDPAVRARSHEVARTRGWDHLNGGNGQATPKPQATLAGLLGWPTEVVVRTGQRGPLPTHYKLDIASAADMVAIECDGQSHLAKSIQERDARKDEFLSSRGWTVLRFSNEEILSDIAAVVAAVKSSISRQGQVTM